jgi:hypothetical protein
MVRFAAYAESDSDAEQPQQAAAAKPARPSRFAQATAPDADDDDESVSSASASASEDGDKRRTSSETEQDDEDSEDSEDDDSEDDEEDEAPAPRRPRQGSLFDAAVIPWAKQRAMDAGRLALMQRSLFAVPAQDAQLQALDARPRSRVPRLARKHSRESDGITDGPHAAQVGLLSDPMEGNRTLNRHFRREPPSDTTSARPRCRRRESTHACPRRPSSSAKTARS